MGYVGIIVTLLGFAVAVASVGITSSAGARLAIVVFGIAISLFGIIGLINPAFQKKAVWRKE
jgi:hypothetical protein